MSKVSFVSLFLCLAAFSLAAQNVNVMSFNIRNGVAKDGKNAWENRRDAVVAMLGQESPDLFGVQEAYDFQRDYILGKLPRYKAVGRGRNDGSDAGEHMSIFYDTRRFELEGSGDFWLSETPDVPSKGWDAKYPRIATWVLLKDVKEDKSFFVVNTHFDHIGVLARRNSMKLIRERVSSMNPDSLPMVVMGDFNLKDGDSTIVFFNTQMNNARDVALSSDTKCSFNGWGDPSKEIVIDYIYFTGWKACTRFRTITGEWLGRTLISDHNPICATLITNEL